MLQIISYRKCQQCFIKEVKLDRQTDAERGNTGLRIRKDFPFLSVLD